MRRGCSLLWTAGDPRGAADTQRNLARAVSFDGFDDAPFRAGDVYVCLGRPERGYKVPACFLQGRLAMVVPATADTVAVLHHNR